MQLFYSPNISEDDISFNFDKDESRHIVKVLRKNLGDVLFITDGKGWLFEAEISSNNPKSCSISIKNREFKPKPPYSLHLAVAPTKMNERYEWFIEKATEIGVDEITPIICDNSERKVIKLDRFNKILQSAMKQSLQYHLPKLNPPILFKDFIAKPNEHQKFIAHCEESNKDSLKTAFTPQKDCTILIGPEGDFSVSEIESAVMANFKPIMLGKTRLRTETAALVACHTVAILNEL